MECTWKGMDGWPKALSMIQFFYHNLEPIMTIIAALFVASTFVITMFTLAEARVRM